MPTKPVFPQEILKSKTKTVLQNLRHFKFRQTTQFLLVVRVIRANINLLLEQLKCSQFRQPKGSKLIFVNFE